MKLREILDGLQWINMNLREAYDALSEIDVLAISCAHPPKEQPIATERANLRLTELLRPYFPKEIPQDIDVPRQSGNPVADLQEMMRPYNDARMQMVNKLIAFDLEQHGKLSGPERDTLLHGDAYQEWSTRLVLTPELEEEVRQSIEVCRREFAKSYLRLALYMGGSF